MVLADGTRQQFRPAPGCPDPPVVATTGTTAPSDFLVDANTLATVEDAVFAIGDVMAVPLTERSSSPRLPCSPKPKDLLLTSAIRTGTGTGPGRISSIGCGDGGRAWCPTKLGAVDQVRPAGQAAWGKARLRARRSFGTV
jgi:hypothetical protein